MSRLRIQCYFEMEGEDLSPEMEKPIALIAAGIREQMEARIIQHFENIPGLTITNLEDDEGEEWKE